MKRKNKRNIKFTFFSFCLAAIFSAWSLLSVFALNNTDISPILEPPITPESLENDGEVPSQVLYRKIKSSDGGIVEEEWVDENGNVVQLDIESRNGAVPYGNLPPKYSLVDENYVTSVKNQGQEGLCWAFAGIGSIESNLVKSGYYDKNSEEVDYSEAHLGYFAHNGAYTIDANSPIYGDGKSNSNIFSDENNENLGGNSNYVMAIIGSWSGAELEKNAPYENRKTNSYNRSASYAHIKNAEYLTKREEIKSAIMNTGAVSCSYFSDTSYYKWFGNKQYYTFKNPERDNKTNHAVLIVGWDDNFSKENFINKPTENGAWLIKNSWGNGWGKDGYFWMSYEEPTLGRFCSFSAIPANKDYDNNYQYDGFGGNAIFKGGLSKNSTIYTANVFKSSGNEIIKAASFHTVESDINAKVQIYLLNDSPKSPVDGKLIYSQAENYAHSGYHTMDFGESIYVKAGQSFSVSVAFSSERGTPWVYYEGANDSANGVTYSSKTGQSFMSTDGKNWTDSSADNNNNMCVKAFTDNVSSLDSGAYSKADLNTLIARAEEILSESGHSKYGVQILRAVVEEAENVSEEVMEINNTYLRIQEAINTIDDYFIHISSADDFVKFAAKLGSENFENYTILLDNDIVFSDEDSKNFTTTYTTTYPAIFNGEFIGNNHKISGIKKSFEKSSYKGVFPHIGKNGVVRNLIIDDCHFDFQSSFCGILTGKNEGTISNCVITNSSATSQSKVIGGVAGDNEGSISGCVSYADITGDGYIGGITGQSTKSGNIVKCANYGGITATGDCVGGIIGFCNNESLLNDSCYNIGNITGGSYVGGIAGFSNGKIANCYSIGNIIGNTSGSYAGIIAGVSNNVVSCRGMLTNVEGTANGLIGSGNSTTSTIESKEYFKYGVVAYMLNSENSNGNVFGQADGDDYPVFANENHHEVTGVSNIVLSTEKCTAKLPVDKAAGGLTITIEATPENDVFLERAAYSYGGNTYTMKQESNIFSFVMPNEDTSVEIVYSLPLKVYFYDGDKPYSDETAQKSQNVPYGLKVTEPEAPQKEHYDFQYWSLSKNGEAFDFETPIKEETKLYAVWKATEYDISINTDGGVLDNEYSNYNIESENIIIPSPVKKGYDFLGWSGTGIEGYVNEVIINKGSFGDREYTANWQKIKYNISYNSDGGVFENQNPLEYYYDSDKIIIFNPTKAGYVFAGWSGTDITGAALNVFINSGSEGNREYTANWVEIPTGLKAVYNQKLSDITLPKGFEWKNNDESVGNAGKNIFKVRYLPYKSGYPTLEDIEIEIDVEKANPTYSVPMDLTAETGQKLADVLLPDGFIWEDDTQGVGEAGINTFAARYIPLDKDNYNIIDSIMLTITVVDSGEKTVYGDVDNIPGIDVNDAVCVLRRVLETDYKMPIEEKPDGDIQFADVDGDGILTAGDAAMILKKANSAFIFPTEK